MNNLTVIATAKSNCRKKADPRSNIHESVMFWENLKLIHNLRCHCPDVRLPLRQVRRQTATSRRCNPLPCDPRVDVTTTSRTCHPLPCDIRTDATETQRCHPLPCDSRMSPRCHKVVKQMSSGGCQRCQECHELCRCHGLIGERVATEIRVRDETFDGCVAVLEHLHFKTETCFNK